ncbi:ABC transporter ATP-binding protein [uncultured Piscinibacter sp.]|uniref:ABC transporter ATP-binding protein n=1 Tax=uncultured Piscinibacter sp. TaxID=1131835 RepID=UPI0026323396|nr:ABC transporter ATP-binding protein [uncultured Piscinibacter sp.]
MNSLAPAAPRAAATQTPGAPLLQIERLHKRFALAGGRQLHAVDDLELSLAAGESLGLVGESGCGKSTLVRLIARLLDPSEGRIVFDGEDLAALPARRFAKAAQRSAIQMVFQDPTDSLNPRFTAREAIREPLTLLSGLARGAADARVEEVAAQVGLPAALLSRFPHQLSGGQKARVGIARALAVKPRLLILDEPTAALDVSVQAVVLQLLEQLRAELGLSLLFVSHDLNVVRLLTDRVAVMYLGKLVEVGPSEQVFRSPKHPYTQSLVSAIPGQGPRIRLSGEVASPIDPPPHACRFHGRCPRGEDRCAREAPPLRALGPQRVACHFAASPAP